MTDTIILTGVVSCTPTEADGVTGEVIGDDGRTHFYTNDTVKGVGPALRKGSYVKYDLDPTDQQKIVRLFSIGMSGREYKSRMSGPKEVKREFSNVKTIENKDKNFLQRYALQLIAAGGLFAFWLHQGAPNPLLYIMTDNAER